MMNTETHPAILNKLRESLPRLAPFLISHAPLQELALDSMDHVELLCTVHQEFGIRLTEQEFQPQYTLDQVAQIIATKLNPVLS